MARTIRLALLLAGVAGLVSAAAPAQVVSSSQIRRLPTTNLAVPSGGPHAEPTSVPVPEMEGMLRRMRVYLFAAPAGSTAFGLGEMGTGRGVWALLPSCRSANPDDSREPCPVDRITLEVLGEGRVFSSDPQGLTGASDTRRVQVFRITRETQRLRLRLMGPQNRMRYEAVIEAARLVNLSAPQGHPDDRNFAFDLTQYPAR